MSQARIIASDDVINLNSIQQKTLNRTSSTDTLDTATAYYLAIVRPTQVSAEPPGGIRITENPRDVMRFNIDSEFPYFALDLETRGTNPLSSSAKIYCVGLTSWSGQTISFYTANWSQNEWDILYTFLGRDDIKFIGHNVMFDGAWLAKFMGGLYVNWSYDTLALYKHLANEGYPIQNSSYGLKNAQIDLLGWDSKGDETINEWLVMNGHYTGRLRENPSNEEMVEKYQAGKIRPDKSKMYLVPKDILSHYCGLDTYSTMALFRHVFIPSVEAHTWAESFWSYQDTFMLNLFALIEQFLDGILIDVPRLEEHHKDLEQRTLEARKAFMHHPQVKPHIEEYRARKLEEYANQAPDLYKKLPTLGNEPVKLKKDGTVSKNWIQWDRKRAALENGDFNQVSQAWIDWDNKMKSMQREELFNLDSGPMRSWLFYEALKFPVLTKTESGRPETGKNALKNWGELGQLLKNYNDTNKETQMVQSCLNNIRENRIHPQFKAPGTFTGRLAGGSTEDEETESKFNIQQIPKKKEYLSCWIPDPGHVFVDVDATALEPVVLTALSRDPNMLKIYGPTAKPNDIYLFVGSQLPGLGPKIRASGYDPENPTAEGIARAKKECKKERGISKTIVLGSQYGMGPKKLRLTLSLEGIQISEEEAYQLWKGYWDIFSGIKEYKNKLENEWQRNQGWVLNAIKRPVCCGADWLKDLPNRVVQSSGHDLQMMIIEETLKLRSQARFPIKGIIWDFHDQSIVQVPEKYGKEMIEIFKEAYKNMNTRLHEINPEFKLNIKGDPAIVHNLAEAKIQE